MKALRQYAFVALLALCLTACAGGPLLTSGETLSDRAAETIADVETGLTIAYKAVTDEAKAGIFTKAELTRALEQLDKASAVVSKAQDFRRKGLFAESLKEALQSKQLLGTVQALLVERIKQQRKPS